jgi:hypothetical protein
LYKTSWWLFPPIALHPMTHVQVRKGSLTEPMNGALADAGQIQLQQAAVVVNGCTKCGVDMWG